MLDVQDALRSLSGALAPAGFEENAAAVAASLLREFTDDVRVDRLGNVIGCIRCGIPGAKTVLWDAHLDEIGVMVTSHDGGYATLRGIGGMDARALMAQEVTLLPPQPGLPPVNAMIACLPPHVQNPADRDICIPVDKLYLDLGLSPEEAVAAVPVGTVGCFAPRFTVLGDKLVSGKALDDRAGFVALLRALELLRGTYLPVDIVVVGSAQEETGGAGAAVAAYGIAPDIAFAVDMTFGAAPGVPAHKSFPLGGGVAVGFGPHMHRFLSHTLFELAKEREIPCKQEIMPGHTGTNGSIFQTAREGIPTAVLSIPLRYMHTPVETLHLDDLEAAAKLLAAWALSPKGGASL